jgi:hypothetical protein
VRFYLAVVCSPFGKWKSPVIKIGVSAGVPGMEAFFLLTVAVSAHAVPFLPAALIQTVQGSGEENKEREPAGNTRPATNARKDR